MKRNRNVFWIGINSFFTDLSSETIKPVLPLFMYLMGAPLVFITLFFNISEFLSNIFKIIFGYVSDKFGGIKNKMMIGYLISNLLKPLMGILPNLYSVFIIELLNKIGKGIRTAPKEIIIKNSVSDDKVGLGFGFQKAMDSLGAFLGTILATLILLFFGHSMHVIQNMFLLTIIPGIISAFIIYKFIHFDDTNISIKKTKNTFSFKDYSKIGNPFFLFMIATFITSIANTGIIFYILSFMKFQIPYYWITGMYSLYMLTDSILGFYLGKLSDSKNVIIKNIYIGYIALALSIIMMILVSIQSTPNDSIIYLFGILAFILYGIFESIFDTGFKKLISINVDKKFLGTALGSYSGISGLTKVIAGIPLTLVFVNGGGLIVYLFCFIILMFGILYFSTQIIGKIKIE